MNKRELDLSGITAWHKAGYTGKDIRIANLESTNPDLWFFHGKIRDPFKIGFDEYRNTHGTNTADILHQVAPDSDIFLLPSGGAYGRNKAEGAFVEASIPFMETENIHLVNASLKGNNSKALANRILRAQHAGVTFVNSAGNDDVGGIEGYPEAWILVGAVSLNKKGEIVHAQYSSLGEEVDFTQFSGLHVHDARKGYEWRTFKVHGTSFSSPMVCGMLALVQQFFLEKAGRTLNQDELYEFMKDYSIDLWEPGKDIKSGYGLFLLPEDPESIDIEKYLRKEEIKLNKPEYIVIHHSATEQGDAAAFRRYHKSLGWRDIGYHYVINNGTYQHDGFIEKGRPESENGAHAINYNSKSIGICLVGNFDKDKPTSAQMTSLVKLTKDIIKRYKIPIKNVLGHRETGAPKTCPGKNFDMKGFRLSLKEDPRMAKKDYKGHWAESSIEKVKQEGLMAGFPDGSFKPNEPVTRAQLAAVLARLIERK